jgi:hypothetical protein
VKALTVRQPWAWAIIHGGKLIENRTQPWAYRGPLAIHAGTQLSVRGVQSPLVRAAAAEYLARKGIEPDPRSPFLQIRDEGDWMGKIVGVVDLVDAHRAGPVGDEPRLCCESPWAECDYQQSDGRHRSDIAHLVLENPRPLIAPISARGQLGLWSPDRTVVADIDAQLEVLT